MSCVTNCSFQCHYDKHIFDGEVGKMEDRVVSLQWRETELEKQNGHGNERRL